MTLRRILVNPSEVPWQNMLPYGVLARPLVDTIPAVVFQERTPFQAGKTCARCTGSRHLDGDRSALVRRKVLVEEVCELHKYLRPPAQEQWAVLAVETKGGDASIWQH